MQTATLTSDRPGPAHRVGRDSRRGLRRALGSFLLVLAGVALLSSGAARAELASCASSGPASGGYTVTVCLTAPGDDATVSGDAAVAATVSVSGSGPGVQRMRFHLAGAYLLADFAPPYEFVLPSAKFADGQKLLEVEALMRDGFTSARGGVTLAFENGNATEPPPPTGFAPTAGRSAGAGESFVVAAVGDGASGEPGAQAVSDQIAAWNPNLFLYLGDVYEKGTSTEFHNWYGTSDRFFGRVRSVTNPAIGNHEYEDGAALGYFEYWRSPPDYYALDTAGWHVVSLNSTSQFNQTDPSTAQYRWLQNDLAASTSACTLVFLHHPRYSIGPQGDSVRLDPIWKLMASKGVDLVLTGHDHSYQRWTELDGDGNPDPNGITQIVAGTGGHGTQGFVRSDSRVVASSSTDKGTFRLELNPKGAAYRFVPVDGNAIDWGVRQCSGTTADTSAPSAPTNLRAVVTGARVSLTWGPSVDNTGVAGYDVYRNGELVGQSGPEPRFVDETSQPRTTYTYTVRARDGAGNDSGDSNAVTVTTLTDATLFADGFESGDLRLWTSFTNVAVQKSAPVAFSGDHGVRATSNGLATHAYKQLASTHTQLSYRFRFKIISQGSTVNLGKLRTASGGSILGIFVSSNGKLGYRNDVLAVSTTSGRVVEPGVWHDLQVTVTIAGASGQTETTLDGVRVNDLSKTEVLGTTPVGRLQLGENSTGRAYDLVFDAVAADPAQILDSTAPQPPALAVTTSDANAHVQGSQVFYNPGPGQSGSFSVAASPRDDESGVFSVSFPALFGGDVSIDTATPYVRTYSWNEGESASGPRAVWATNGSGLSASASLTVTPDAAPPAGGSIVYGDGYRTAEEVALRLSEGTDGGSGIDSDGESLERAEAPLADGACGSFGAFVGITDIPFIDYVDGEVESGRCYRYRFAVPDRVGNKVVYTSAATAKVDALAPSVTLADPGSPVSATVSLGATAADAGGSEVESVSFQYSIAGANVWTTIAKDTDAPYAVDWDTAQVADGVYDVRALAADRAGNTAPHVRTVQVDNTGALTVAVSQPRGYVNAADPDPYPVTATSPSAQSIEFFRCSDASVDCATGTWESLGIDATAPYSALWNVGLDGQRALRAFASDGAGGSAEDVVTVVVDRTAPAAGTISYADGWNTTGSVVITTDEGTDGGSGIVPGSGVLERQQATLAASGCGTFANGWTTASSSDSGLLGPRCYRYRFRVADRAGNTTTYASASVVMVDTQAPATPSGVSANAVSPTQVNIFWSSSTDDVAVAGYTIRRDGQVASTLGPSATSYNDTTVEQETTYSYTVQAFDQAGNRSAESAAAQAATPAPPPQNATFTVVADAYVTSAGPASNFGSSSSLRTDSSPDIRSYLRFSLSGLSGTVRSATLRLFPTSSLTAGFQVARVANTTWGETSITYQNAPAVGSLLGSSGPVTSGNWVAVDVTAAVTGNGEYSLALTPLSSTALSLSSKEGSQPAQLVVEMDTSGNRAPTANDLVLVTDEDVPLAWTPDVSDPDGQALACSIVAAPVHGQAAVAPDCSGGTYTTDADYNGADSFTYRASDGTLTDDGLVAVTVRPVNDVPVASPDSYAVFAGETLTVGAGAGVLANDADVDGQALTAVLVSGVSSGTLSLNPDGSFSYTPNAGFTGEDSFIYQASDGSALSSPATVTIAVSAAPTSFRFTASADSYVNEAKPTTNYGSASVLRIDGAPALMRSYVRFDVSGLVGPVTSVRLRLWTNSSSPEGTNVRALADPAASGGWQEGTLSWANAPAVSDTIGGSSGGFASGVRIEIDVTPVVAGNGSVTLVLTTPVTRAASFASRETTTTAPELIVETG